VARRFDKSRRSIEEAGYQMALTLTLILFGAGLGALVSGLFGSYLVVTRSYRKVRNQLIIGLGYAFFIASSVGALLLQIKVLEELGVARHSSQRSAELYAYAVSFVSGVFLAGRGEVRWRKAVGLDDKSLMLKHQSKN